MKNILLAICLFAGFGAFSQRGLDSLWSVWHDKTRADTVRMQALYEVCRDYYTYSEPDTSIVLTNRLLDMARERNMKRFAAKTLNCQLQAYVTREDYVNALASGRKSMSLFQEIKYYKGVAALAENMAVIYMRQGDYHRSFRLFLKGLKLKEHLRDSASMPSSLINMGIIYLNLGKLDSALSSHERALVIAERYGPPHVIVRVLQNLGNLYQRKKQMGKAFAYFDRAAKLAEPFGSDTRLASVYDHLVSFYRDSGNFEKALDYQAKSMAIYKRVNSRLSMAESMHMLSTVYYTMEKLEKARVIGEVAISMLGDRKEQALRRDMYSDLGNVYYNLKDYKKALHLHLRFIGLRDSLRNDSLTNAMLAEQSRMAMEKKELLLKSEADKRLMATQTEAERRNQEKNIWILVIVSLLAILGLSGYFSYRHWQIG